MEIRKDFKEFLSCLNDHEVRFLIVGAFALAWHGHPRYTGDIDLLLQPEPENAGRLLAALKIFGFGSLGLQEADFIEPDRIIQLGVAPVRIDLLTSITGVDWERAWAGSVEGRYDTVAVRYLGRDEYIANKKATGRHKDLADIEALGEIP